MKSAMMRPLLLIGGWIILAAGDAVAGMPNDPPSLNPPGDSTASPLEQHRFRHDDKMVIAVAFTPDGKNLVTCGWDNLARLWEVETGREIRRFQGHAGALFTVAISPDGKTLASAGSDKVIILWDLATGSEMRRLSGHTQSLCRVALSPDGKTLASSSYDSSVRIWDVELGLEKANCTGHIQTVYDLAFAPDGKTVISGSNETIKIWEPNIGKELRSIGLSTGSQGYLSLSPDGKTIAASTSNSIVLFETASGKERLTIPGTRQWWGIAFAPDGKSLAACSPDHSIYLYETLTGKERRMIGRHNGGVAKIAFSPDGKLLASASHDKTARLWDLARPSDALAGNLKSDPKQLSGLLEDLASSDASIAYQAIAGLQQVPDNAVPLLKKELKDAKKDPPKITKEQLSVLIKNLDSDEFETREKAQASLAAAGDLAGPAMQKALESNPSAECRRRLEALVDKIKSPSLTPDALRRLRAIEVLEAIKTKEAQEILTQLANETSDSLISREASASLVRLNRRKPTP